MTRIWRLAASVLLLPVVLEGQSLSRLNSPLPLWADSALLKSGFWQRYDLASRVGPEVAFADLDGDGLWDVAVGVMDKGGHRRGIAIIHQIDRSVRILGAGQPLGNGRDQLPSPVSWGVGRLLAHRSGIWLEAWHLSGWLVWNGSSYSWVEDSD